MLKEIANLTPQDRELLAVCLHDTYHTVDEDVGDDPQARIAAYHALAKFVRSHK